ncbi:MAG: hydroxylamine oxidoreductase [Planctomycetes bacterium]|nr:hydroxylamine oxidoreductase [Planctomycetota bacterium]
MNRKGYIVGLFAGAGVLTATLAIASPSRTTGTIAGSVTKLVVSGPFGLPKMSKQSRECVDCHKKESHGLYQQWGDSKHYRANVGCYECHAADRSDPDAMQHYDATIATIVSPKDCGRCHSHEVEEFLGSHHSKAARILGSLDNVLAEVVEGNNAFVTDGFPHGNSAAAVNGCWQCHGSQVKVLAGGKLDAATWPNTGIGRINPDGSEGSCTACHARHAFSAAQARHPDTCGKCHMGPDHPQKEVYEESKHGISFFSNIDKMNLDRPKWIVGEDYHAAPTCATCHMSATKNQPVTHDIGMRISWNNRPPVSVRPEVSDAKLGLPGADVPWQTRRHNMQDVCTACHNKNWVTNFYIQYDGLVELYNEKFAKPGAELYKLAKPAKELPSVNFTHEVDWSWWELWHHEGRRARHGASMMGPDYTHWHGTYEVAKTFYTHYVPAIRHLVKEAHESGDPERSAAADALAAKLDEVLNSNDHKWVLGKMDPEEAARRKAASDAFKARYKK